MICRRTQNAEDSGETMNFVEYIFWRFQQAVLRHRRCDVCRGSNGRCNECNEWHNLYKKDLGKAYYEKKNRWW